MTEQVVVVGAGMVGHRFVDELVRRDTGGRFDVHLVGEEPYAPYNRILLSDVLAGRCDLAALALPAPDRRVRVHAGTAAVAVDRDTGVVELGHGQRLHFDHVVLATGAEAFVPPVPGLRRADGSLVRDAHVLRTLDDCRDVSARALNARTAVVLGGGVLGLEAACGLVRRGARVTLVHVTDHLAPAQLGAAPARILADTLGDLGVDVRTGSGIAEVLAPDGVLDAVRLDDGTLLPADLLLVSCGVLPRTGLAADAGLRVGRGVLVGEDLASPDDPRVAAVGDCAEPPAGVSGLVGPGWDQAARLAARLTATSPPAPIPSGGSPVRLKAAGVDLVTMGTTGSGSDPDRDRVVTLSDPAGRRHVELVVRGDRLSGVTCLGAPDLASALAVAYDRGTSLPGDPLTLLLPERAEEDGSPALMPAATPVCRCNGVAKRDVVAAWERGARSVPEVAASTRATTGCGGCRDVVCGLVAWLREADPDPTSPDPTSQARPGDGERSVATVQHDAARADISAS